MKSVSRSIFLATFTLAILLCTVAACPLVARERESPSACEAQPQAAQATPDEPLGNATAPRLLYFSNAQGDDETNAISSPVTVEAYVNGEGEVYDYRIVSGPTDAVTRSQVENLLLFSRFEPARFFGQPVRGLAVLSFSGVSVRG